MVAAAPRWKPALEKPAITLSLAALTWRGAGNDNDLLLNLKGPLDAFREGDYGLADREFAPRRRPRSSRV